MAIARSARETIRKSGIRKGAQAGRSEIRVEKGSSIKDLNSEVGILPSEGMAKAKRKPVVVDNPKGR